MAPSRQESAAGPQATGGDHFDLGGSLVQMMDTANVRIAAVDTKGCVLVWNRALSELTGASGSAALGRNLGEWLTELGARDLADIMIRVAREPEPLRCEVRLPGLGGTMAAAAFCIFKVRDAAGSVTGVMAAGHDLTAMRALQNQMIHAEKLATVGQIAAGVAHEINNPLTSIQMCVEAVLRKGTLATEGKLANHFEATDLERLNRIREGSERIRKFSHDLTAYARPSGRDVEALSLNDVVEHALSFCEHALYEAKATLLRELAPQLPQVHVVRDHIMQVVTNLVSNAAQALRDAGGTIVVRTFRDPAGHVGLVVSDDGEGIRQEDRERVFEPFFTTKAAGRGTGLGLPVVKNIVLAHGGDIAFESRPGAGTTFTVLFPLGAPLIPPIRIEKQTP